MWLMRRQDVPDERDEPANSIRVHTCDLCGDAICEGEMEYTLDGCTFCAYCAKHESLSAFDDVLNIKRIRCERWLHE